jgi:hypothetical protein
MTSVSLSFLPHNSVCAKRLNNPNRADPLGIDFFRAVEGLERNRPRGHMVQRVGRKGGD